MTLAAGTRLGPYEIQSPIGAGGMGEVYKARDTRLDRTVAIKVLPPGMADDHERRVRFEREAKTIAGLNHPHICTLYDVGEHDGSLFLVMEHLAGETLAARLRKGPLPFDQALTVAGEIADALAAAHRQGVIHRDLKPGNMMLTKAGAKLLDFGLAKLKTPAAEMSVALSSPPTQKSVTVSGAVLGTVPYMAPEQLEGKPTDARTDLFALGCVLFEMLSGTRPWARKTAVETMAAILNEEPRTLPDTVPADVRAIVGHCLEKDPQNRFQSARDLAFALAQPHTSTAGRVPSAVRRRRLPWAPYDLAALTLALGLAAGMMWPRQAVQPVWSGVLLGGPERAYCPRPSPDGHLLAFVADVDDTWQVGVMKPESGNHRMLTQATDKGCVMNVSWSADGARLYYDRLTDIPRGIYSVPVLGGAEQSVLEDASVPETLPDRSLLIQRYNSERKLQMQRFWPETGRVQNFPIDVSASVGVIPYHGFPDGKHALAYGSLIGSRSVGGPHLYLVDLESGKCTRLLAQSQDDGDVTDFAIARDGRSIIASLGAGNVNRIVRISADGRAMAPLPITLTAGQVFSLDVGADGSIYLDQWERPAEMLRFDPDGRHVERIGGLGTYVAPGTPKSDNQIFAVLPDGRGVVTKSVGGRAQLVLVESGKDPAPFVDTIEETSAPVTAAGPGQVAFLIGPEPLKTIAVAAVSNGRINRRITFDKGTITSLASSPDGKTLYCGAGGSIWAIPVGGGEPKRLYAGDHVAVDPTGRYLVIEITESPRIRLVHVPLDGSPEHEIQLSGDLRPAWFLTPNGVARDGHIVMPLGASTWYWPAGILDAATGRLSRVPLDRKIDFHGLGWTPDGRIMALGLDLHATMWKFQVQPPGR